MSDKLISANKLMEYIYGSIEAMTKVGVAVDGEYLWGLINYAIEDAPTIDAEPIVRCKDCHYAKPYNKIWQLPKRDTLVCTHFANDEVDNNFFCGYAIKKMDEEECHG